MHKYLSGNLGWGTVANGNYSTAAHGSASEIESVTQRKEGRSSRLEELSPSVPNIEVSVCWGLLVACQYSRSFPGTNLPLCFSDLLSLSFSSEKKNNVRRSHMPVTVLLPHHCDYTSVCGSAVQSKNFDYQEKCFLCLRNKDVLIENIESKEIRTGKGSPEIFPLPHGMINLDSSSRDGHSTNFQASHQSISPPFSLGSFPSFSLLQFKPIASHNNKCKQENKILVPPFQRAFCLRGISCPLFQPLFPEVKPPQFLHLLS